MQPTQLPMQTVQIQMRRLMMSRLIRIYTVWHSVFQFRLKLVFSTMDRSKFKNGRDDFRNSGVKGKTPFLAFTAFRSKANILMWIQVILNLVLLPSAIQLSFLLPFFMCYVVFCHTSIVVNFFNGNLHCFLYVFHLCLSIFLSPC